MDPHEIDQPNEYLSGQGAGYAWLAGDGSAYLDPNDDSELAYPSSKNALYGQGFSDALKGVSWHVQNPGQLCHRGESCPDLAWLAEHKPNLS